MKKEPALCDFLQKQFTQSKHYMSILVDSLNQVNWVSYRNIS
jgi:hypothetical protein